MGGVLQVLLVILAIGAGTYLVLGRVLESKLDPREPPAAPATVPYIGHVIGMMRSKFNYYVKLRKVLQNNVDKTTVDNLCHKSLTPIFTMAIPGQKMYVISTPELIQAVQKQPKTLSFPPIEAKFATQVCGTSVDTHKILMVNVNGDEGDWGLSMDTYSAMRTALSPGPGLDGMNRAMIQNIAASLDNLIPAGNKEATIKLAAWFRRTVTVATTNSVYGPKNPFKDPAIEANFWEFESDLMSVLVGLLPSVLAHKGIAARDKLAKAFENYLRTGGLERASILTENRYELGIRNGVSIEDIARFEVGNSIAILVNTAPAAFWMALFLYSNPDLLADVRKEVGSVIETTTDDIGDTVRNLDITNLKTSCPLLTSAFQESLRHRSMGTSVRQVMEDTVLDSQWLLKKDSTVQMPSRIIHMDTSIWGADAEEFKPRRFLKENGGKRPHPTAFRGFGGGSTLCPGRHFATNEILAVVSMFVMRFDLTPLEEWALPKTDKTNVAAVVMEPDTDIEVKVTVRKRFENGRWAFGLRDSKMIFALVDEDCTEQSIGHA